MTSPADPPLRLECIDAAQNMWRYYQIELRPTLFGEHALVRCWGRIGAAGRRKTLTFCAREDAERAFKTWETAKRRRGYRDVEGAKSSLQDQAAEPRPSTP